MQIKIKKLQDNAKLPFRATQDSAGADLFACLEDEIELKPRERKLIATGIAVEIPKDYGGFVFARSSLAFKHGVSLSNCVGVIDADYRGEVKVALINHSTENFTIKNGDRIAQLVILPVATPDFLWEDELSKTQRGDGGFGSTGE